MPVRFVLTLVGLVAIVGCSVGDVAAPREADKSAAETNIDREAASQGVEFQDLRPGDWQLLTGELVRPAEGADGRKPISYRFEVGQIFEIRQPQGATQLVQIRWSKGDEQKGEFLVPREGWSYAEHLQKLSAPFGEGQVVEESVEPYQVGDRTFACRRLERSREDEYGLHRSTVWLSGEAPVTRVVAYHSSWQPAPQCAALAPATEITIELSAYGDRQGETWSR
jgi:hypothetical protein